MAKPVVGKLPDAGPDKSSDYYGERAKEVLDEEKKNGAKLHPLQVAAPDYDVLVCEAGCQNGPGILARRLKVQAPSATADKGTSERQLLLKSAECRGGCYDTTPRASIHGLSRMSPIPRMLGADAGTWMTTVKPEKSQAAVRPVPAVTSAPVTTPTPAVTPAPAAPPADVKVPAKAPAPTAALDGAPAAAPVATPDKTAKKPTRDDWMTRINRERDADKPAGAEGSEAPLPGSRS